MNRTHRASYTAIHPQIVHTLSGSNLRRSRLLRRSVSNLLRCSCRSAPQSTPVHPQIEHTLNASNLRRSRPLRRSVSNLLRFSCRSVPQSYESYTSCIVHSQAPSNRTHPQRQQPSTEQAIETQREQPFEVQLPQCTTEHARHAED